MKGKRILWFLSTIGLLVMLVLLTGCYRPASPDITPTPLEGAEVAPSDEDIAATAVAEATRAAQPPEETEPQPTDTSAPPSPAPLPTSPPAPAATEQPEPAATEVPATSIPSPTSEPEPTSVPAGGTTTGSATHVVGRGENLYRIALRYGTTVQAIASANGIANPGQIYVGQRLVIPSAATQPSAPPTGGTTYVVQRGDNLFRIALRFNLNYVYLAQYNGIANSSRIRVGQVLRIPPH